MSFKLCDSIAKVFEVKFTRRIAPSVDIIVELPSNLVLPYFDRVSWPAIGFRHYGYQRLGHLRRP